MSLISQFKDIFTNSKRVQRAEQYRHLIPTSHKRGHAVLSVLAVYGKFNDEILLKELGIRRDSAIADIMRGYGVPVNAKIVRYKGYSRVLKRVIVKEYAKYYELGGE